MYDRLIGGLSNRNDDLNLCEQTRRDDLIMTYITLLSAGNDFTSDSDVCRRQNRT